MWVSVRVCACECIPKAAQPTPFAQKPVCVRVIVCVCVCVSVCAYVCVLVGVCVCVCERESV